ncbi:SIMPL domain-containing protein [Neptunicella marina]|uniref:SIMPL domain-containing protein n=1 Tax=Neptunicella marina TaxID=2125989 RepID=A0A8J6IVK3_9ALTE|nr:SIMPL domain-containing protein [Neptunicella marina]MBC3767491.1 SIMPL domain-containing protein [Neptunicella marina]
MKYHFVSALFLFFCSAVSAENVINVSGKGQVSVVPDQLQFSIYIEEKGPSTDKLNAILEQKSELVASLLKKYGVEAKDVQSLRVQLSPWMERQDNHLQQQGFVLSRQLKVTLRDLANYGKVIDGLLKIGPGRIDNFQYMSSDHASLYDRALTLAVENASKKAKLLASAGQVTISGVQSINEVSGYSAPAEMVRFKAMDSAGGYLPGEMQIKADVQVTFTIASD